MCGKFAVPCWLDCLDGFKMIWERNKAKSNGGRLKSSKLGITVLLVFMVGFVIPTRGFMLRSCRISRNIAKCDSSELRVVPQDLLPTVKGFDLSSNNLTRIRSMDFANFTHLIWLDLKRNNISQIDSKAFASLSLLRILNLNQNKLVKLEEDVFNGLKNLTELRIAGNCIKVVESTSFKPLTSLIHLDISSNKLQNMSNVCLMLQHLPHLQELLVAHNEFKSFNSWELTNSSLGLHVLDLSRNPLKEFRITADVFPHLTCFQIGNSSSKILIWDVRNTTFLSQVSTLDISNLMMSLQDMEALFEAVSSSPRSNSVDVKMNAMKQNHSALINMSCAVPTKSRLQFRLNHLKVVGPYFFKLCVNVTQLDLAYNKIHSISENAFTSLESLKVLILSHNCLSSVPDVTRNLQTLSMLDLSSNHIRKIDCHSFANHTTLTELRLYQNSVSKLHECTFKDLVKLETLQLQTNKITKLNGSFSKYLSNLKQLRLNANQLTTIEPKTFKGLKSLRELSLHENNIKQLYKDSFDGLTRLTRIRLLKNGITVEELNTGAFNALVNLKRLDLSLNRIKYDSSEELRDPPFSNLSHLKELLIPSQHYRDKSHLPKNILQGLTNLSLFKARNMQLLALDKDTFKYTPNLKNLDISSNDLNNLSPQLFSPIQNLESLYISRTDLQSLDFFINANLTKLEFLQARKNQYSVITEDVMSALTALAYLDFQGNSFTCDCDNAWFLNWAKTNKQTQVFDGYNFRCNYPGNFKGKMLVDFDPESCIVDTGFICFTFTSCATLCFMLVAFIYHFMRWQLVYAYYLFVAWLFDTRHRNKQARNQYDAFVSYNAHDEPWVIGELLPKLEGEQGWKLCLHHRDFEPGRPIIDNITHAIYGSRKTICVISYRYLESEWCSREIQAASFRLFDEQKDVLILVFLEDIPSYLLAPYHRMRKMLKKKTYLSWPKAREQPKVFWEKLRQALNTSDVMDAGSFFLSASETP